ncbi:hypothetical protein AYI92_17090 [Shewanella xiamenensis]|uniref:Uncharacterized protein n=1 Tax=Shewanella xiamenensis TaxID=332186 RepID=A0ABT6UCD2_9GAMM|nr:MULTISPECIES: hypothetical protein [Shewanella]MCH7423195.1 hypothetical protein [Shewanella sp. MM_2022_3]MDI5831415.1 hypothetical protein [Shewanella xiamenensis]TVL15168.1 hypothetical protein AYI90_16610 [Shewanella xiamenensis]TVL15235.1 hypothetical protein AYI91_16710 [Shewanella xiamenensis]TVL22954.1 hypothetical protein AYI92_17090 [Shewanella xiamenensis]
MSELRRLVGEHLVELSLEGGELFARFGCGSLRAFTPASLTGPVSELVGRVVQSINFKDSVALILIMGGGATIEISLAPSDYSGPEAFCARFNDGVIVVENKTGHPALIER